MWGLSADREINSASWNRPRRQSEPLLSEEHQASQPLFAEASPWGTTREPYVSLPEAETQHCSVHAGIAPRCTISHLPYLCPDGSAALAGTSIQVEVKQDAWVGDLQVWVHVNPSFQALKTSKHDKGMPRGEHRDRVRRETGSYPCTKADATRFT